MLIPRQEDAVHKAWLLRLLTAICEHQALSSALGFKGGTCAAMRGFLDRFSIDLDFDLLIEKKEEVIAVQKNFKTLFKNLGLIIKDQSKNALQYFLKYPTKNPMTRNTIKLDSSFPVPKANRYEMARLPDLDRVMQCQTLETMAANKLVALINRHERGGKIAGRDLFDVHHFLMQGYPYDAQVILELRKTSMAAFLGQLIDFVSKKVTNTMIDQDLNPLLPNKEFQRIRKILKQETLQLLTDELRRVEKSDKKNIL